jgi:Holliday junction resolvase-like predicted endonuclease
MIFHSNYFKLNALQLNAVALYGRTQRRLGKLGKKWLSILKKAVYTILQITTLSKKTEIDILAKALTVVEVKTRFLLWFGLPGFVKPKKSSFLFRSC